MANMQELLSQRFEVRKQKLVSMDIVAVAESLGMKLKPGSSGTYYWEEHDSFHIYPNTNTFRWWSRSIGSNTIDLVQVVREELTGQKPSFKEAAAFLETGQFENVTVQPPVKEPFEYYLERYEHSDFNIGRQYLKEERGLSDETIDTFLASGNLATATHKKGDYFEPVIVFKSRNNDGKMIGASLQGIVENRVQHPERGRLKQMMKNSDGTAGFSLDIGNPKRLVFAEAPIDLMSYYELHKDDLQDVKLVAMDGMKKSVISRYVADMLTDGKYSQTMSNEQIRGALDALNKTTNILQEHPDMITLAVDNDEAGQNFVKGLQEDGIPVVSDLPPRKEGQTKMDWNDYLKQEAKPKKSTADETWNIDDIQEQLSQESDLVGTQAVDVIYMNEVYLNQGYSLSLAVHSNEEVENLTDVAAPWTLEVMRNGQSLGYLAYGEDWGNDFDIEDELVNLENWVKDNQVTNHLYSQKDINAFLATTQAVEPKRGEFVLKGGGIYDFGESQKEGEELRQRALDWMISDITDAETYYLWHDEELEKLNAPDEAFINFHYHLKDIEYNQNDIHLYVAESSTDGVTGYLSLDGNSLDSDSIEEYLADQDWTFDQKVQFLKNLKTAVDETWDKVIDHYDEQFNAIVAQYGLSSAKEKAPEILQETEKANFEHQKKAENPIEDLPEQSQEAAPLPSTHEEYSLNESSPTQTQSQPLLHFTISDPERSIYKLGYHPVNKKELNKLNRYAAQIQENATWYKNELANSNVTYFYKNNDNLEALKVTFKAEQYPHLVGIFAIDDDQSATKTLDDLASGKGDYQNIMVANRGATFSKIQVLPDFKAVVDSNSFIFDDLSEVERMKRLDLAKAIRTEDKDVLIAFRNVDGEYLPASLMKVTNKLESELSIANNKDVLGIVGEKDGEFKVLSVNEEIIKDGGEKMLSIVKNNQFENLSKAEVTAEDFTKVLDAVYNVGAQVGKDNRANIPEELYPAWDKYYEYAERYDNNFDVIVKVARADNLLDENSDFYKEVWLKKIQEENQKVKDSDGDGLTDDEEIALGTNPYSPDSDGDGILDSVEKASGTDATNPSDTPDSRKEEMAKRDLTLSEMIKAKNTAALNQHLQEGIKDYFDSDNYKNFLEGMSHFNNYSVRNIQLIKAQLPEASMVASFNEWKKRNGHVNKGEKALYVQAPVTVIKKDADGKPIINSETGEKETFTYFKPVPVFDISQFSPVEGKKLNLPKMGEVIPSQITKEYYQNVYRSLRDISQKENGIPIRFRELEKSDGSYSPKTNEITIKKGMTYEQTLSTLIHEMAHSELHNKKSLTERFEGKLTRSSKELQAESIAYVVSNHLGFDTSNDSFAYLASWSKEQDGLENLKAQLEIVQEEASSLMKRIDKHLAKYQNLTVSKNEKLTESQKRELSKAANPFYQSLQKAKEESKQVTPANEEQSKKVNRPTKQ
ncbi:PBECR4 domain-containing protein [Streptococcus agalactiae]|uniref:Putative conjugative transposon membrane protein n=1 Tax=Streptococcus agalactiae TaxID=1311 RepID=A0A8B4RDK3_STRAG|nr:PBECR4 domain-containing protein [Streptococcus agalactiae]SUN14083.1 putative conjugative transposon membrane protein [Streptococcus agalactiae]